MKYLSSMIILLFLIACKAQSQESDLTEILYTTYENHKENSLEKRRIKHADLQPLIEAYANNPKFSGEQGRRVDRRP